VAPAIWSSTGRIPPVPYPADLMPGIHRLRGRAPILLTVLLLVAGCGPTPLPSDVPAASGASVTSSQAPGASPAGSTAPLPEPSVAPARWSDCGNHFQCAAIPMPRDYLDPSHGTLTVELIRLPASNPARRIGSLIMNPGGPGGSGIEFIREGAEAFPRELRQRFDLVGFDPRGVNASSPVRCIDNLDGRAALDPSPDNARELAALVADAKAYAGACEKRNAENLPYLSTDAVAHDLDRIRAALGDSKLTYLGFSYGTLIGSTYAQLFPTRIRAMALDGAVDPSLGLEAFRAGQAVAFEASLHKFLTDCAKHPSCDFYEGGRSARAFDALMARIDKQSLPTPHAGGRRRVGPGLASSAVLGAMYSATSWSTLASALAFAKAGDGSLLLLISDPFRGRKENGAYSNQQDAYTANTCLDFPAPTAVGTYTSWANRLRKVAPHFAQQVAYNDLSCAYWAVHAERTPARVQAAGAPPIVVVGSTGDPATPYKWAVSLAKQLASGVLVTRTGFGHTGYEASRCVREALDAYLLDLKVPRRGLACSS
jgi:pimeloyl-ACP methyl ester carboxylesterase